MVEPSGRWENWSGSVTATPERLYRPETEDDLVDIVERHAGETIRAVGAGHSFTRLGETDDVLVAMDRYTGVESVDREARRATVRAGTRLESMNAALAEHGLAVENMGDIDQQRLAGALATGTHGTGEGFGVLSTQVERMRIVTPDGVVECSPDERPAVFRAAQVSLGALGLISTLTLRLEPAYSLRLEKRPMDLEEALERVDDLAASHRHFEFFWYPGGPAKVKLMDETDASPPLAQRVREGLHALAKRAIPPRIRYEARDLTDAMVPQTTIGPSHEVFPSVRDIRFNEMEYGVPRGAGPAAMREVSEVVESHDVTFPVEFRVVAGDDIPLSPAHGRDSVFLAVHKHYRKPYREFFDACESVFRSHDGRPHWGKHHSLAGEELAALYPEWDAFHEVRRELDPDGTFLNGYLRELFGLD